MACSGRAEVISTRPDECSITGTTATSLSRPSMGPPRKSTANRQLKYSRVCPTTPPRPVRVATQRASDGRGARPVQDRR